MIRVRFIRNTVAEKRAVMAGEIVDIADADARSLIAIGKAVEIPVAVEPAAPVVAAATDPGQAGETPLPHPGESPEPVAVATVAEAAASAHKAAGLNTQNAGALIKGRKHKKA